jgi:uncharacterized membrane protein (DUF485 family)
MVDDPAAKWDKDKSIPYKIKLGMWMFLAYCVVYGGFIIINLVDPKLMGTDIGSLNLAIVYGFALIILALIMALVYNFLANRLERKYQDKEEQEKGCGQ